MQEIEQDIRAFEQQLSAKYNKAIHLRYHLNRMSLSDLLNHVRNVTTFRAQRKTREQEYIVIRHLYFKMASELGYTREEIGASVKLHHSSVTYGIRTINRRIQFGEKQVIDMYNKLKQGLL